MYASPNQQNRALLIALAINIGFILAMCIVIAGIGHSWDAMITLALLTIVYVAIVVTGLIRYWRRSRRLDRESREWSEVSASVERE